MHTHARTQRYTRTAAPSVLLALLPAGPTCAFRLLGDSVTGFQPALALAEVALLDSSGQALPVSALNASLSSVGSFTAANRTVTLEARFCTDGATFTRLTDLATGAPNSGPGQICSTFGGNEFGPWLTVRYACGRAPAKALLSSVDVGIVDRTTGRPARDNILAYRFEALDGNGRVGWSERFSVVASVMTQSLQVCAPGSGWSNGIFGADCYVCRFRTFSAGGSFYGNPR